MSTMHHNMIWHKRNGDKSQVKQRGKDERDGVLTQIIDRRQRVNENGWHQKRRQDKNRTHESQSEVLSFHDSRRDLRYSMRSPVQKRQLAVKVPSCRSLMQRLDGIEDYAKGEGSLWLDLKGARHTFAPPVRSAEVSGRHPTGRSSRRNG